MGRRLFAGLLVVLGLTAFAPVPLPREPAASSVEAKQLQGTWDVVSMKRGPGLTDASSKLGRMKVRIEGDTWTFLRETGGGAGGAMGKGPTYKIVLNARAKPCEMDLVRTSGPPVGGPKKTSSNVWASGIVRIEGKTVQFCYVSRVSKSDLPGPERPKDFKPAEARTVIMTLQRASDAPAAGGVGK